MTCPPKIDPDRMRGSKEQEAENVKKGKAIHTRTNHHQTARSRSAAKPGDEHPRSREETIVGQHSQIQQFNLTF
jgi:hypothetical protein